MRQRPDTRDEIEVLVDHTTTRTQSVPVDWSHELDRLGPVDLADLLLATVGSKRVASIALEPTGGRHLVRVDHAGSSRVIGAVDSALADATCARLALIAGLEFGFTDQRLGRVRVQIVGGDTIASLLVAIRGTSQGLGAALHRIVELDDGVLVPTRPDEVGGRYRLEHELGRGGMGVVFRAEHVVLKKPVAIKVLHPGLATDPELAALFVLEAQAACRARHPGIVDVTDFGRFADGRAYIVMELVDGRTLAELLGNGPLTQARVIAIARRIASALRAAADAGVVHRDLKPANIFVLEDDRIKIGDFGVACILEAGRESDRQVVGTASYMAPEQARGLAVDTRADLYALGCVMFEMLAGHLPYRGASITEVLEHHVVSPIPPIESPYGPVAPELVRVVHRAMAKQPDDRYQTAEELLGELVLAARAVSPVGWQRWQA
jgi:eukaryotic-like serine/threonine-protein kinase